MIKTKLIFLIFLMFINVISAFSVVYIQFLNRQLHITLNQLDHNSSKLEIVHNKFVLETQSFANRARIENLAISNLEMIYPEKKYKNLNEVYK